MQIAAKCPRFKKFGAPNEARKGLEHLIYELAKTHKNHTVPWINRFFDVQFIHGWPFVLSRYRNGSLEDLIANPLAWSPQDRVTSLIQIVRALRLAGDRGLAAHQDLKPANVFFDALSRKGVPKESKGMHFHMYVGDFGNADAFRDFGRNSGSRPYMAPEQFSTGPFDHADAISFDVFALGVIAFECLTDGIHPMGVTTRDVWPMHEGVSKKWKRESTWREWAKSSNKSLPVTSMQLPIGIRDLIIGSLSADSVKRPTLAEFENRLWDALDHLDSDTRIGLEVQVNYLEGFATPDAEWPHMDERLRELQHFYSSF